MKNRSKFGGRALRIGAATLLAVQVTGLAGAAHADDAVAAAKAAVAKYAGPQTTWEGPTSAPKPMKGMKVVYLSGDEQNDISHEYGRLHEGGRRQARLGCDGHRRQGQPDLLAGRPSTRRSR